MKELSLHPLLPTPNKYTYQNPQWENTTVDVAYNVHYFEVKPSVMCT